jgi:catechol 2,3-dioxygenase-like lactoylglutathione lyase family enzyme
MSNPIKVTKPDHIVLNVRDIEVSLRFYVDVLGLKPERLVEFRDGKVPFPSVRTGEQLIDLFPPKMTNLTGFAPPTQQRLNHFCVCIANDVSWDEIKAYLKDHKVEMLGDVNENWGAWGYGYSLYIRDPDGNVVELKQY